MPSSSPNINNIFFEGSYKYAWKEIIPPGLTEAEVDFILEVAALKKGNKVLDMMCGYGRHALELGRREIQVTAVDNLSAYTEEVNAKANEESLAVDAVEADILQIKFNGIYDAAICMGNSFTFFDKEDAATILKNVSNHLKPGGILIINSWMIAEVALKHFKEKDWHYAGPYKCIVEYKYCFYPSRIESEQTIIAPDGSVEIVKGIDYIFTLDELEEMFNKAGFKTSEVYSTPRKKRFAVGDGRVYIVAEKLA